MKAATMIQPDELGDVTSDETLCARVGSLLGLGAGIHSEVDLIDRLEKGLAVASVQTLRARTGLTDEETFQLIAPRRTLSRREAAGQSLSREEADKTVRIARITARAQQVFGGKPEYVAVWLREPKSALGERTPMQALATESGALAVEELLVGIEHGMFA
jgi:putative toxin-antitoxin system antitoxin component (TIGR02293 family)